MNDRMARQTARRDAFEQAEEGGEDPVATYARVAQLLERLHRHLHEIIRDAVDQGGYEAITPAQALLLFHIGDQELAARDLRAKGYYLGSNVTHNLKKLVETGFVDGRRSERDRRTLRLRLTDKGRQVHDIVRDLYGKQAEGIMVETGMDAQQLSHFTRSLAKIERFWSAERLDT